MFPLFCSPLFKTQAEKLLQQFPFILIENIANQTGLYLQLDAQGLALCDSNNEWSPLRIDFTSGKLAYRQQHGGGRQQPLARAIGLKPNINPEVLDLTAGLGRDSFVLASLGCTVHLLERSPVIAALLQDGLQRAEKETDFKQIMTPRLNLHYTDALNYLKELANYPDTIYLDPMYPHRQKSALVKKEMRIFRHLVGNDEDAPQLLQLALSRAKKRVVVKRPKGAPTLDQLKPNWIIESENTRYDVYLSQLNNEVK